jgi:hypothetical protein
VLQVLDQAGPNRPPAEELLGRGARGRVVQLHERAQEAEVGGGLVGFDADRGQVQAPADGLGDVTERYALVTDSVQPRPGRRGFQRQPVQPGRVELVHGRPPAGPVADVAGDALVAGDPDQARHEAMSIRGAVHGRREPDH